MKVLWLCGWYPNMLQPLEGDFIQRYAKAVSLYCDVHVMYAIRDAEGEITKDVSISEFSDQNLTETIIYYYSRSFSPALLNKYLSFLKFRRLLKNAIRNYVHKNGKPDIIHVHSGMKIGLLAMWLNKEIKAPYVVTEQWTGFLPEAKDNFTDLSPYLKHNWKRLIKKSVGVTVVSSYLGNAVKNITNCRVPVIVIPNVVNTSVFFPPPPQKKEPTSFVHISGMDFQKNPEHILQAFAIVKKCGHLFSFDVFGAFKTELKTMVADFGLTNEVHFHGEVPQPRLSLFLGQAAALILYSRYETFGCVIIEANACGVPVIVSDIPVLKEIVEENKNGVYVRGEDPQRLAEKLILFINKQIQFDSDAISKTAREKYNYGKIGKQFYEWYKQRIVSNQESIE